VLLEQVALIDSLTPATRIGPWSSRLAVLLTVLGLLMAIGARRPDQRPEVPPTLADPELVEAR
jgi:hypothetical protein